MGNREMEKIVDRSGFFGMTQKEHAIGARLRQWRVLIWIYWLSSASFTAARVVPIRMKKANMTLG